MERWLFELGEDGGEVGEEVGVRSVQDGALGDNEVVGGGEFGEEFGQKCRSDPLDPVAVDGEFGRLF